MVKLPRVSRLERYEVAVLMGVPCLTAKNQR